MTPERGILTLAQWLSPSFPVGAFAYSHGLETAIHTGAIQTANDLQVWLEDVLRSGSGRNDCILLRAAYSCNNTDDLLDVDTVARATAASFERLQETQLQGAAFCQTASAVWGTNLSDLTYPVAVGCAAKQLRIDVSLATVMYLHALASNLVSVAVRAVPLGQTEGQTTLAALTPICEDIAAQSEKATLDDLQSTAFLSDVAAMNHETLQPRIFRS
jgi:urease accessory protein